MLNYLFLIMLGAFPVDQLDQDSPEYLNAKSVGVFTNEYKQCTAWSYDFNGEHARFITNNHCTRNGFNQVWYGQFRVGEKFAEGRLDSYHYGHDYSLLATSDLLPEPLKKAVGKRQGKAYIVYQWAGRLLISYCNYWRTGAKYIKHLCSTKSGASGAPVFDAENNKVISYHWGWSLDEQGNKLEGYSNALEVINNRAMFYERMPERFVYE